MKTFVILCALAGFTCARATEDRGKRSLLHGLGLDFASGYTGYGSGRRSHGNSYGYGTGQDYGYGVGQNYGVSRSSGYGTGEGYYSDATPIAIPYNTYPSTSYAGAYPSSGYAAAASYSAPSTKVVAVSKVVNVQREVTIPQVVNVRKVITEPKVITVKQVLPSPGYTGYGTGVTAGYVASGYSGAYAGAAADAYSAEYPSEYSGTVGTGAAEGWW